MPFLKAISRKFIREWEQCYMDYDGLKQLLLPFRPVYNAKRSSIDILKQINMEELQKFDIYFQKHLYSELRKVTQFFTAKLNDCIKKFKPILITLAVLKEHHLGTPDNIKSKTRKLKYAFHTYLKELHHLNEFYKVNHHMFRRILEKHRKYIHSIYYTPIEDQFFKILSKSRLANERARLSKLTDYVENLYLHHMYKAEDRAKGLSELKKISHNALTTRDEVWFFGLFFGFGLALICVLAFLGGNQVLTLEDKALKNEFPIFRGIGLFIFYYWMVAWNIYGWSKYGIDYKLIFLFKDSHYSHFTSLMRRASLFTLLFLIMLIWYMIIAADPTSRLAMLLNSIIPKEYDGLVVWAAFFVYFFFPNFKIFNGKGRKYLMVNILKAFIAPFIFINYPMKLVSVQFTSFVQPFKDLSYTICYYVNLENISKCQTSTNFLVSTLITLLPNIAGLLVFPKLWIQERKPFPPAGYFTVSFSVGVLTTLCSYFSIYDPTHYTVYITLWLVFGLLNGINLWYIDVKLCWGFLNPKAKYKFLRPHITYPYVWAYYAAMIMNFPLRYLWTITISPSFYQSWMKPQFLQLLLGYIEIFRRGVWNFFAVEQQHINNLGAFRTVPEIKLPYSKYTLQIDPKCKFLFMEELDCYAKTFISSHNTQKEMLESDSGSNEASYIEDKIENIEKTLAKNLGQDISIIQHQPTQDMRTSPEHNSNHQQKVGKSTQESYMMKSNSSTRRSSFIKNLTRKEIDEILAFEEIEFKPIEIHKILKSGFAIDTWLYDAKELEKVNQIIVNKYLQNKKEIHQLKKIKVTVESNDHHDNYLKKGKPSLLRGITLTIEGKTIRAKQDNLIGINKPPIIKLNGLADDFKSPASQALTPIGVNNELIPFKLRSRYHNIAQADAQHNESTQSIEQDDTIGAGGNGGNGEGFPKIIKAYSMLTSNKEPDTSTPKP